MVRLPLAGGEVVVVEPDVGGKVDVGGPERTPVVTVVEVESSVAATIRAAPTIPITPRAPISTNPDTRLPILLFGELRT